jgi:O-antigen ligase
MAVMVIPARVVRLAERLFVIGALLLFSRAFLPLYDRLGTAGTVLQAGLYAAVFGIILLLIVWQLGRFLFVLQLDRFLLLLLAFVPLSLLWSVDRGETLASLPVFYGATALGIYLAARFSLDEQLDLLFWMLVIITVASLALGLLVPGLGIMQGGSNAGSWQGVFAHKNDLGRFIVLAAVVSTFAAARRRWAPLVLLPALALLVLSESATSAVTLVVLLLVIPVLRLLQRRRSATLPLLVAAAVLLGAGVAVAVLSNATDIIVRLGKDLTLTGRTEVWADVWTLIQERMWLGYGYNAFWLGLDGPSAYIWARHGWRPNHAHNGFLDLWLELGLIGVALVVTHVVVNGARAWRFAMRDRSPGALWPLTLILLLLLFSINYSVLVSQSVFFWALYLGAVLGVRVEQRRRARAGAPAPAAGGGALVVEQVP